MAEYSDIGVRIPEILLPNESINMSKWSVVACDQFSSQREYWEEVARYVGGAPSMLHIVLPEVYLNNDNVDVLIADTKANMKEYIQKDIFVKMPEGIMLTERTMNGVLRKGILLAVDLERYDYRIENKPTVRATEKTLLERIPPRIRIREGASVESPHVMVLMDDVNDTVIGPLHDAKETFDKVYDFDMMMDGGHITGYFTSDEKYIAGLKEALAGLPVHDGMRFCVGDGNHSLATAKTVWDNVKKDLPEYEKENHPLRFALCEFVNIHDDGIQFMPIHRVLFKVTAPSCLQYITDYLNEKGLGTRLVFGRWRGGENMIEKNQIPFLSKESSGNIVLDCDITPAVVACVQEALDNYISSTENSSIDYIHGEKAFEQLSSDYDALGLYFAAIDKATFFETVIDCGVLPKKTFSMGEAEQKRYYLECRKISTT